MSDSTQEMTSSRQQERRPSEALIIHPLSLYNNNSSAVSPPSQHMKYADAADWNEFYARSLEFQRQEVQHLVQLEQQKQQLQAALKGLQPQQQKCLLDFTCEENLKTILGFLDGASLCAARRVCRYFNELGDNDLYWFNLCRAEWSISPEQLRQQPESYQALYKYACRSLKLLIRDFYQEQCLASMQRSFRIPRDSALLIAQRMSVA